LIFKDDSGKENELSFEEFEKFKREHPKVAALLMNPDKINAMMEEGSKEKDSWEKVAKKILGTLWKMRGAYIFFEPVDPKKHKIDDYFDIIKNPMDFGTIKTRLNANIYQSPEEFYNDVKLVFSNCIQYNGTTSDVGSTGVALDNEFEALVKSQGFDAYLQRARENRLNPDRSESGSQFETKGEVKAEPENQKMEEDPPKKRDEMRDEKDEVKAESRGDIEEEIKEIKEENESKREGYESRKDESEDIGKHMEEEHESKGHQMEEEKVNNEGGDEDDNDSSKEDEEGGESGDMNAE